MLTDTVKAILGAIALCVAWFVIGAVLFVFSPSEAHAFDEIYLKVGAGYKIIETDKFTVNGTDYNKGYSPISARAEFGRQKGNLSYGISHHSQWLTGWPLSDEKEYSKTELFVDYKWSL